MSPRRSIVHIGLGAFHRAHQAVYTQVSDPEQRWEIVAFTGRSDDLARTMTDQHCRYTLIERAADGDAASIVTSIVEAHPGRNVDRLLESISSPATALVTLTLTETGYRARDGRADTSDPLVVHDIAVLKGAPGDALPVTAIGRLLLALDARRRAGAGPIAIVPCDNIPNNGGFVRDVLLSLAERSMPRTGEWIGSEVSFVSTVVDRITPRQRPADLIDAEALTGWRDLVPVVTEPFSEWILSGDFPAGRPAWERAGAQFVTDVEPYERRKLWLLNAGHTLLAGVGWLHGHSTIDEAARDPECAQWLSELWAEAKTHLPAETSADAYCERLRERFANPRIRHDLDQIAEESLAKIRNRIVPVLLRERAAGRDGYAATRAISAWMGCVVSGRTVRDSESASIARAFDDGSSGYVERLLRLVDERLADDDTVRDAVAAQLSSNRIQTPWRTA